MIYHTPQAVIILKCYHKRFDYLFQNIDFSHQIIVLERQAFHIENVVIVLERYRFVFYSNSKVIKIQSYLTQKTKSSQ